MFVFLEQSHRNIQDMGIVDPQERAACQYLIRFFLPGKA
jgi:hypothetical protein